MGKSSSGEKIAISGRKKMEASGKSETLEGKRIGKTPWKRERYAYFTHPIASNSGFIHSNIFTSKPDTLYSRCDKQVLRSEDESLISLFVFIWKL